MERRLVGRKAGFESTEAGWVAAAAASQRSGHDNGGEKRLLHATFPVNSAQNRGHSIDRRFIVLRMVQPEPTTEQLKVRQHEQETAEHKALSQAETEAEADKHQRRADKARYLREKLEEQERADREA
jgi:hypothetical protein